MPEATLTSGEPRRLQDPKQVSPDIQEWEEALYRRIVSHDLTPEVIERIRTPPAVYPGVRQVLAVHWHSEHVPMEHVRARIDAMFPDRDEELIIPTNHNVITSYDGHYAGVEVDCYSKPFRRKVQLLIHFEASRLEGDRADAFRSMLAHTFSYRRSQLADFFESLLAEEMAERRARVADHTGIDEDVVRFVQIQTRKLREMLQRNERETPAEAVRNKLLRWYFDGLAQRWSPHLIHQCQAFIREVKKVVKKHFNPEYFYETDAVIEEVRALGGCIIIPHPEQFWPILLSGYDVDGYEVWNPQSRAFTDFLIGVVHRQNRDPAHRGRPLLCTMGDDCHLGEKTKDTDLQDVEKAKREVGVQPWDNMVIRKSLMLRGMDKSYVIREYKARLAS